MEWEPVRGEAVVRSGMVTRRGFLACLRSGGLLVLLGQSPRLLAASNPLPGQLVTRGSSDAKRLALSFDDGPGPETDKFLGLLDRHNIKATFFVSGELVGLRPEMVKKTVARGHEIGSHTWNHTNYKAHQRQLLAQGLSEAKAEVQARRDLLADMQKTHAAVEKAAGVKPTLCRMPHGIDRPWVKEAARDMGYVLVNWSYGADWNVGTAKELLAGYLKAIQPGAILLFHDGGKNRSRTLEIAEEVIRSAKAQGFEVVTVGRLLQPAGPAPTTDTLSAPSRVQVTSTPGPAAPSSANR